MCAALARLAVLFSILVIAALPAAAQEAGTLGPRLKLPNLESFRGAPDVRTVLPKLSFGNVTMVAELIDKGPQVTRGLVWRVFGPQAGEDGKLPLIASARGGTSVFHLDPGSYLVHASYGRAGATKRITVGKGPKKEVVVLDAGGLKLDAVLPSGGHIPPNKLRFSIYEAEPGADGERALIIPDVRPDVVVRLNAGTYHVVSKYGSVNAVIRSDIRVTAGQLTEATVEHRAAQLTMKLVRDHGGEAIADTSWTVLTDAGDGVRESVGAFATMVLAEGDYTVVAKNRGHTYQRALTVEAGHNEEVEVLTSDVGNQSAPIGDISD
ncbi:MAG: hypothetical protein L0I29_09145 [Hyphomicrobiales bacterium]|nr:hypothetical protein [Hyphomicrobiales bacterium]